MADVIGVVGCFLVGCHADTANDTIEGPTAQENAESQANSLVLGADVVLEPGVEAAANAVKDAEDLLSNTISKTKINNIAANKIKGDAFRDTIAQQFKDNGYGVELEKVKQTPFGVRRIDIEISSPEGKVLGGIETKTGTSRYTPSQQAKDYYLQLIEDYSVNIVRDK